MTLKSFLFSFHELKLEVIQAILPQFACHVYLGTLLNCSVPQFSSLYNGEKLSYSSWESNELMYIRHMENERTSQCPWHPQSCSPKWRCARDRQGHAACEMLCQPAQCTWVHFPSSWFPACCTWKKTSLGIKMAE